MGNLEQPDRLSSRWAELTQERSLQSVPYKIELNAWGKVEMSPASNRHSRLQGELATELKRQLGGTVLPGCSILTRIGIRAPDVAWASSAFLAQYGEITPFMRAPEICAEIFSPSNTRAEIADKTAAYFAAGAVEVWIVAEDGSIRYFTAAGEQPKSGYPVAVSLPPPIK